MAKNLSYTAYVPCSDVIKSFSNNPFSAACTELGEVSLYIFTNAPEVMLVAFPSLEMETSKPF